MIKINKSVIVIDTPDNCWTCQLNYDYLDCMLLDGPNLRNFNQRSGRHPNCPLTSLDKESDNEDISR